MIINMRLVQELYEDNINFFNDMVRLAYSSANEYSKLMLNLIKPASPLHPTLGRKHGEEEIAQIQTKASNYLSILYNLSKGDHSRLFDMYEIGDRLGYEASEVDFIVENLSRSELISGEKASGKISITPYGVMIMKGEITVGYAPIH
jgi:DNA-binding MarR family transcriptional regulator